VVEACYVAAEGVFEGVAAFEELVVLRARLYVFEDFCVFGGLKRVGSRLGGSIHLSCVSPDVVSTVGWV